GTLLLREVGALPRPLQGRLLRALDEGAFESNGGPEALPLRARLIATAAEPLGGAVAEGRLREDLYHRLSVGAFHLPPLRQRPRPLAPLAQRLLAAWAAAHGLPAPRLAPDALRLLEGYPWPGNVRQLGQALEAAAERCGHELRPGDLPEAVRAGQPA